MTKINIAVARGGPSNEHEISLKSGQTIINNLNQKKYNIFDLVIQKNGKWILNNENITPEELKNKIDIVFPIFHGEYGESGDFQKILENLNIKYIGTNSKSSKLSFSKIQTKEKLIANNIPTPNFLKFSTKNLDINKTAQEIENTFLFKKIIKASESGSSFGIYISDSLEETKTALKKLKHEFNEILIEPFIMGKEYTCGILEGWKGEKYYALPVVEIIPDNSFFDFESKYQGKVQEICPALINEELTNKIQNLSKKVFDILGLKDFSRIDFIHCPNSGLYVLEANNLPGMTEASLYPQELNADNISLNKFIDFIIEKNLKD